MKEIPMKKEIKMTEDELQLVVFKIGAEEFAGEKNNDQEIIQIRTEYLKGIGKINDRLLIQLNQDKRISHEELQGIQTVSIDSPDTPRSGG
jgi:chemotaxis signal transduction protein